MKARIQQPTSPALPLTPCSPLASRPRHRIEIRSTFFDGWKTVITLYDSDDETAKAKSKEVFYYYRGCLESRIIYEENVKGMAPGSAVPDSESTNPVDR